MRPEANSRRLLSYARSKAKMYEYGVAEQYHIKILQDPANLFPLTIGVLGEFSARYDSAVDMPLERRSELREGMRFASQFFDSYLQSRLNGVADNLLLLLGSAAYYLCDLPGSASVLANRLDEDQLDLGSYGLERLLAWYLKGNFDTWPAIEQSLYSPLAEEVIASAMMFSIDGSEEDVLLENLRKLRDVAYSNGTARQLLLADTFLAVAIRRLENSTWKALPDYSGLPIARWREVLAKPGFIRELWPAQHLLGKSGVLLGRSAVVQMPTSAGKTKASELIIRSALMTERARLVVVVAPFRALCHEIRDSLSTAFRNELVTIDELSDALQYDFTLDEWFTQPSILVVTPEKLVYVLRQEPGLAQRVGLLIYDEGHQFDSGTRGITYELLLTALKNLIPEHTQTVLVSAVISNANAINQWLNGDKGQVVVGENLLPTGRTLAFASWADQLGSLEFVEPLNPEEREFFVPRIIESNRLLRRPKEKQRFFPERNDGMDVALYLAIKLAKQGSVAIFYGRKDSAIGAAERLVEIFEREVPLGRPAEVSDKDEINKLYTLTCRHLGEGSVAAKAVRLGVLTHHRSIPHGLRLASEHAIQKNMAKIVLCTSTLAQGVNLPIRYLIVTGVYQGGERITVRDFHNLIGRAGRAGMFTEGSIVFSDPNVFDKRRSKRESWRWESVKDLLDSKRAEPCVSTLLTLFEPIKSDDDSYIIQTEPLELVQSYISDPASIENLAQSLAAQHGELGFSQSGVQEQVEWKLNLISAVEGYLLAQWGDSDAQQAEWEVSLARETLAYFLADDGQKETIIALFTMLRSHIDAMNLQQPIRKAFARTLLGLRDVTTLRNWLDQHRQEFREDMSGDDLLGVFWPIVEMIVRDKKLAGCSPDGTAYQVALFWITGVSFENILSYLQFHDARRGTGKRPRRFKIEHVVDICENVIAFDVAQVVAAAIEIVKANVEEVMPPWLLEFELLHKRLKYGLPSRRAVAVYEAGITDRVIAMELADLVTDDQATSKRLTRRGLRDRRQDALPILGRYPTYFAMQYGLL